ncbi:hypothetical protein ACFYM2_23155 [Streptomyces sp. NPDC006711]|uniref:hypothetical protein n=1 Tax=unclassified Streptomyces TaxID=2593676 RepID=UPI0036CE52A4
MAKSLDASDVVITHGSGIVASPFDCSPANTRDDNDSRDTGGHDGWAGDDSNRCN